MNLTVQEQIELAKGLDNILEIILKEDPLTNDLITAHLIDLLNLEEEATIRLYDRYIAVADELRKTLSSIPDYTFTKQHYNQVLVQVESGILQMQKVLFKELDENEVAARLKSIEHLISEIVFYEPQFESALQVINLQLTQQLENIKILRLAQYQSSVERYGLDLIIKVQDILVKGAISQKFYYDLNTEIMDLLESRFSKANEIMVTEVMNAYNETHLVGLQNAAKEIPDLKKQWLATLDSRTGSDSIALNGQIREVNEPFDYYGKEIDRPPTRPRCRCRIVAYKDDWGKEVKNESEVSNS